MTPQTESQLFCALADPERPGVEVPESALSALAERAVVHNVGPIVLRKLDGGRAPDALREQVQALTVLTLRLELMLPQIRQAMADQGLSAIIVKGPVFAAELYPDPADRPFTDLDILAPPEEFDAIGAVLMAMGLHQHKRDRFDRSEANQEQKWISADDPNLLIEVHGDLVHYPGLRRRVRLDHGTLTEIGPATPTAWFLTAVAHGALGHKFHTLRLVLDVLQGFRRLDADARADLLNRARAVRLELETLQSLYLIGTMFDEAEALALSRKARTLTRAAFISGEDVLSAPTALRSKLKRHLFRQVQRYTAR